MTQLTVTTARKLTDEQQKAVLEAFAKKHGGEVTAKFLIDEDLVGGIIVFDGDRVYDGSVKTKLESIKGEMANERK